MKFDVNKAKTIVKSSFGFIAVMAICAVYILMSLLTLTPEKNSIPTIIINTAVLFLLGLSINEMMRTQGIINGMRDDLYRSTVSLHGETVIRISQHIDKLDEWCEIKNEENLKNHRVKLLAGKAMRYEDYFGENGKPYAVDESRMKNSRTRKNELERLKTYEKALNMKLTPLTSNALTCNVETKEDTYKGVRSKEKYLAQNLLKDALMKVIISFVLGYYGVGLIQDFQWSVLIWHTMQVCLFLVMGVVNMKKSYLFITDEYRQGIVQKINNLNKFEGWIAERSNTDGKNI